MANILNTKKVSLTTGLVFAVMHTVGVIGIRIGLMKYWGWVHLVSFQYVLEKFNLGVFALGIVTAFLAGLIVGWLFTAVYNSLNK